MKITPERLADLQRMAERATLSAGSGIGVTGPELLELILGYRQNVIDLGELAGAADGSAFLGGMLGGFAGGMLHQKLSEFQPQPKCRATRGGRCCTLPLGHDRHHHWGPLTPSDAKPRKKR